MTNPSRVRWGIVGTAHIAEAAFLPALRAAGGGTATLVGSRDAAKAMRWAAEHGVERGVGSYLEAVTSADVDAVYVCLPNHLHAEWTIVALRAGKAVLCEKPLCASVEEAETVLRIARETGSHLWEAFVFPFQKQFERLKELTAGGELGEVREVQSSFYFELRDRRNIRLSPDMYGGALADVGCYPLRFAEMVFDAEATGAVAVATWAPEGVDAETQGVIDYPGDRRLLFGCGIDRPNGTFTRILGTEAEVRLTNPFHCGPDDTLEVLGSTGVTVEQPGDPEPTFTNAIRHIHAVLRGAEAPRHLASDDSLATARALDMVREQTHH
jgi:predicted dehydrogenase